MGNNNKFLQKIKKALPHKIGKGTVTSEAMYIKMDFKDKSKLRVRI